MRRIDRVYDELARLCLTIDREQIRQGFEGFSTEYIAEKCGFQRSNTSRELNRLVEEGVVQKSSSRPVLYFDMARLSGLGVHIPEYAAVPKKHAAVSEARYDEDFSVMLKRQPNLEVAIRQGKAAMLYPPHGLHTILTGQSGVGKTFFAEAMYHFCVDEGLIPEHGRFVVFNCAEYASNPQLLLSNLFGYVKGAFTGADREQKGIIDQADGGLLFLDEVHRLPASGQELLFLLIDKGYFRRLGDSERKINVQLRLVCATTENVEEFMLMTFRRRIPMSIHLPSLEEYSIDARYRLIELFFTKESANIGIPIHVSGEVLICLLYYRVPGNIGQLRGDIQLTCARAFLEMQGEAADCMKVKKSNLPDFIIQTGLVSAGQMTQARRFLQIPADGYRVFRTYESGRDSDEAKSRELYRSIHQLYADCLTHEYPKEKIINGINKYIDSFFGQPVLYPEIRQDKLERLKLLVGPAVCETTAEVLNMAELRLNRKYRQKVFVALALHISVLLERLTVRNAVRISPAEFERSCLEHPEEFAVAREMMVMASQRLGIVIPEEEAVYFTAFLYAIPGETQESIGLLLLMYGKSTAGSMAEVANSIFSTNLCHSMDVPLPMSEEVLLTALRDKISGLDNGCGVLVLTDMAKLAEAAKWAGKKANIPVRTISAANTAVVIEAVRKCLYRGHTLNELYTEVSNYILLPQISGSVQPDVHPLSADRVIAVTCISGLGAAIRLSNMIKDKIPELVNSGIRLIPVSKDGDGDTEYDRQNVIMVIGSIDLHLPGIPFISMDEMITGQGFASISRILGYQVTNAGDELSLSSVQQVLGQYLSFIEPEKAIKVTAESFGRLQELLPGRNLDSLKFSYMVHCACLIERALWGQQLSHDQTEELKQREHILFAAISQATEIMNERFCIKIADTEIAYIVEMVDTV